MLTLLASFAQEESRSISENVKWGIRKGFQKGIVNSWIGYTYIDRKNKVCDNVKNTLRRMNICLIEEKEEPIPKNLSNRWLICKR